MPAGSKVPEPVPPPDGAHHLQAGPQLRRRRRPRPAAPPPLPGAPISLPARCCRRRAPAAAAHAGRASRPHLRCDETASAGPAGRSSTRTATAQAVLPDYFLTARRWSRRTTADPRRLTVTRLTVLRSRIRPRRICGSCSPTRSPLRTFFDETTAAHAGRSSMRTAAGAWTGASSASRYASWCLQALVS